MKEGITDDNIRKKKIQTDYGKTNSELMKFFDQEGVSGR